jgi:hypothetical protein
MRKVILNLRRIPSVFSPKALLNSRQFRLFLETYFESAREENRPNSATFLLYDSRSCLRFFRKILERDSKTIQDIRALDERKMDDVLNLVDSIYDYWRKTERYLIYVKSKGATANHRRFLADFSNLSNSIVNAYRDVYETILGHEQSVYRILPSGGNAGCLLAKEKVPLPSSLSYLNKIPLLESVVTQPPFMITTRENTRKGFFFEKKEVAGPENFITSRAYGVMVRILDTKALVYFDQDYLGFLVSLGNLFQVETYDPKRDTKIDAVVLFGTVGTGNECYYYKQDGVYVGVLPHDAKIDYFGYAKKMLLTLFNLIAIERKLLPIHGAGVRIRKGEKVRNFVLLGDSGAGKSETLEAIRSLYGQAYQIDTIFDDMGTFHLQNGRVYATGTEIGAFVRLDDLEQGYSLRSVDRAVYLNIDRVNSRVVIPIEDMAMTYTLHKVDAFLLADNYTNSTEGLTLYSSPEAAREDFILGKRVALNTTSEKGLVSTFFANPFGPMQKEKEVRAMLPSYFDALFTQHVPVGRLFTRLSLDRKDGPKTGAESLIRLFQSL